MDNIGYFLFIGMFLAFLGVFASFLTFFTHSLALGMIALTLSVGGFIIVILVMITLWRGDK